MNKCKNGCDYQYKPATNEDGWFCDYCDDRPGEPPGYSPHLDRQLIEMKIDGLLQNICDVDLIYTSNNTGADMVTARVADRCVLEGLFDQYSILLYLLEEVTPKHATYWSGVGDGIRAGNDPRDRCHCGQLATLHIGKVGGYCSYEHAPEEEKLIDFALGADQTA